MPRSLLTPRPMRARDWMARTFDDEVFPLVCQRFGDMLLRGMSFEGHSQILEIGCAAGAITHELVYRLDGDSRVVALDASSALLDRARGRLGQEHTGRRVFFRSHAPASPLPFAEETFDVVLANLSVWMPPAYEAAVAELARVAKPDAPVVIAVPLRGTWMEFLDIYREVLTWRGQREALDALERYIAALPEPETFARLIENSGLNEVQVELEHWELVFKTAREFFYAPVIEMGPLPRWKEIAGRGEPMQDTFLAVKHAIDTYFSGHPFSVSVVGGRFGSRKQRG